MKANNKLTTLLCLSILIFSSHKAHSQGGDYQIASVGFYNFENLFDTIDSPDTWDVEFTPAGSKLYTPAVYADKLDKLASVVSTISTNITPDGLAILGVAEIENISVLEDFVVHPKVAHRNYKIVHYDSPDFRGIDVGLLYNPKYFTMTSSKQIAYHPIQPDGDTTNTRDILLVSGLLDGESIHIMVNHWPSRRGGEARSSYLREGAAKLSKSIVDSLTAADVNAKIILMGDFNDDPTSPSIAKVLNAQKDEKKTKKKGLYNPMHKIYTSGQGTLAYRDAWSLFDQIIISKGLLSNKNKGYKFYSANIYKKLYMTQKKGKYKGYPMRSFSFDEYQGGYSDHFPVYMYLVKKVSK